MFQKIKSALDAKQVGLIAVSKTHAPERIMELYALGQRVFGENKTQELAGKYEVLPKDIDWHMIGHLQRNKVKYIASFVRMIHSVDSLKLLEEINKQAQKHQRVIDCLLQFHIAREETKFGLDLQEAGDLLNDPVFPTLENIRICGVMGMASFSEDQQLVRSEFRALHQMFEALKSKYFEKQAWFKEISMGMSGDWEIAIEEGSTMVRIGSAIFGQR
jgi:PLP dependent protein